MTIGSDGLMGSAGVTGSILTIGLIGSMGLMVITESPGMPEPTVSSGVVAVLLISDCTDSSVISDIVELNVSSTGEHEDNINAAKVIRVNEKRELKKCENIIVVN